VHSRAQTLEVQLEDRSRDRPVRGVPRGSDGHLLYTSGSFDDLRRTCRQFDYKDLARSGGHKGLPSARKEGDVGDLGRGELHEVAEDHGGRGR
jgi:hypothetical protein